MWCVWSICLWEDKWNVPQVSNLYYWIWQGIPDDKLKSPFQGQVYIILVWVLKKLVYMLIYKISENSCHIFFSWVCETIKHRNIMSRGHEDWQIIWLTFLLQWFKGNQQYRGWDTGARKAKWAQISTSFQHMKWQKDTKWLSLSSTKQ